MSTQLNEYFQLNWIIWQVFLADPCGSSPCFALKSVLLGCHLSKHWEMVNFLAFLFSFFPPTPQRYPLNYSWRFVKQACTRDHNSRTLEKKIVSEVVGTWGKKVVTEFFSLSLFNRFILFSSRGAPCWRVLWVRPLMAPRSRGWVWSYSLLRKRVETVAVPSLSGSGCVPSLCSSACVPSLSGSG